MMATKTRMAFLGKKSLLCIAVLFTILLASCSSNNKVVSDEAKALLGVSGFAGVSGNTVSPVCGNGIRETGERCDDGNTVTGDGCSRDCKLICINDTYHREKGIDYYVKGFSYGFNNVSTTRIMTAPDFCFSATVLKDKFCGANDKIQEATFTCPSGCVNGACTPVLPVCGNGVVEGTEQCDDGNTVDTDACKANCNTNVCGDGVVNTGVEACDDGNTVNTDACTNVCQNARCGDMIIQNGVEVCDDGNLVSGDGCSATCLTSCTDTDPGDDVLVVGSVEYKSLAYTNRTSDVCANQNYLNQQRCGSIDISTGSDVFCGSNQCSGGVCTGTCTSGVTTIKCGVNSYGRSYTQTETCRADGHSYVYGTYTFDASCPAGTVCVDGRCA